MVTIINLTQYQVLATALYKISSYIQTAWLFQLIELKF